MTTDLNDDYEVCPHCGAELRMNASFCRYCGASEDSGWGEADNPWSEDWSDGDSPEEDQDDEDSFEEDDFDYDEFVAREFPEHATTASKPARKGWQTAAIAMLVLIAFVVMVLLSRLR